MEHEHTDENTHNEHQAHDNLSGHGEHHGHAQTNEDEMKLSGNDIILFLKKIFKAGSSRNVVCKNEEGGKVFKINLILLSVIFILIPFFILMMILFLIITDYSLNIQKRQ